MNPSWQNIHKQFALNGVSHSKEALLEVAYSLIKEGKDFEKPIGDFLLDWCSPKPSLDVYTSGSTGAPKKITLQKSQMLNSAMATGQYFGLEAGNTALLCLPVSSIAGKMMLVRAMVLGLRLDYVMPSSRPLLHTSCTYDFCAMVPLQAEKSLEKIGDIKTLILGGAAISFSLEKKLKKAPSRVFETYGMTETITHVAVRQVSPTTDNDFKLLPFVEISQDDRQCLVLKAPKVSSNPVVTNDLVELTSKTSFKWLGRYDNVINSGGIKLIPEQIEKKLSSMVENRFFVIGVPDETLGQKLILVVEGEVKTNNLSQAIAKSPLLGKYEIPKEIFSTKKFIETKTGKVQRDKTLDLIKNSFP
ncbi:AMP-binding protein [Flagellimonas meridianipacifica]|uniref:O-succinylbenzoic acid--CoA ligase n=1 Tax=Flagellimonas meridianipacifica TaxID=1080225 RepID=A0A2T0MCD9_9FLAO|nr:AMP-binding protein [Allomuricauda pacifica]PRX55167.1 O-succinylbenzoic acid--CoA ligase [Allomuricauda pacifica]